MTAEGFTLIVEKILTVGFFTAENTHARTHPRGRRPDNR